ncbi:hypothetical protein [Parasitella parasitica]|uniref:Uncharacterized protein n=1 Tax=Parasitella parasitica TaxID=35722 RepID=A0A0B7MN22_9FUNG|nr:hypothetical protein [Parasitella parasitica]
MAPQSSKFSSCYMHTVYSLQFDKDANEIWEPDQRNSRERDQEKAYYRARPEYFVEFFFALGFISLAFCLLSLFSRKKISMSINGWQGYSAEPVGRDGSTIFTWFSILISGDLNWDVVQCLGLFGKNTIDHNKLRGSLGIHVALERYCGQGWGSHFALELKADGLYTMAGLLRVQHPMFISDSFGYAAKFSPWKEVLGVFEAHCVLKPNSNNSNNNESYIG